MVGKNWMPVLSGVHGRCSVHGRCVPPDCDWLAPTGSIGLGVTLNFSVLFHSLRGNTIVVSGNVAGWCVCRSLLSPWLMFLTEPFRSASGADNGKDVISLDFFST